MELRGLRYFVTAADLLHFGRAAEHLGIVQAAVSQQIARLEIETGLRLFDRSRRRVTLTPEGEVFLAEARRVLAAADRASALAADLSAGRRGVLRIGTSERLGPRFDAVLAEFRRIRPMARLDFRSMATPDKVAAVRAGTLDVAFVRAAAPDAALRLHPAWSDALRAVVPASWVNAETAVLPLSAFRDRPLALANGRSNPGVRRAIEEACAAAGFAPIAGPPFTTLQDTLSGHVAAGDCWTLVYADATDQLPSGVQEIRTDPAIHVPVAVAAARRPSALAAAFLEAVATIARTPSA